VSDLEIRISRYLDGEASAAEAAEIRALLERSPEARALLREMMLLSRAARKLPSLDAPRRSSEARLFRQLMAEGFTAAGAENAPVEPAARVADLHAVSRWRSASRLVPVAGVMALLLLVIGSERLVAPAHGDLAVSRLPSSPGAIAGVQAPVMPRADASFSSRSPEPGYRAAHSGSGARSMGASETSSLLAAEQTVRTSVESAVASSHMSTDGSLASRDIAPPQSSATADISTPVRPQLLSLRSTLRSTSGGSASSAAGASERTSFRVHSASESGASTFAASLRPGVSYIGKGGGLMAQEMSIRFDASLGEGHRVSLIAGQAPTISEIHTDRTRLPDPPQLHTSALRTIDDSKSSGFTGSSATAPIELTPVVASAAPVTTSSVELRMKNEVWLGVGYSYTITPLQGMRIGAGAKAGSSPSAWRVGIELPVSYQMMKGISVEAVPAATFVSPHDRSSSSYAVDGVPGGFSYQGESQRISFTSIGLEIGLCVELDGR
jgi:anti-sigma factor RsiW